MGTAASTGISCQLTYMAIEYVKKDMDWIKEAAEKGRTERITQMLTAL